MSFMTQSTHNRITHNQVVIRALSSITSDQAVAIAGIVHSSGQAWDVQAVDDYNGYLSILIEPTSRGNKQKALFIAGTAKRLELFEAQDDDLALIGIFNDIEALGAQLAELVGPQ